MSRYRHSLPQLSSDLFLTDGGLETTLIYHEGIELPQLAAFTLLEQPGGRETLANYYRRYLDIARQQKTGFILESNTWRASHDWGYELGYNSDHIADFNFWAIELMEQLRAEYDEDVSPIVISGCMGPRGDGYKADQVMSAIGSFQYHRTQISAFRQTSADLVTAFTIPYVDEAIGIAQAAMHEGIPIAIGFTTDADGRLPSGETLHEAIERVDDMTDAFPAYYMINCAHPTHFIGAITDDPWTARIHAVRANASAKTHEELDTITELDDGNVAELADQYTQLARKLPNLNIFGGCCGTDHRHVEAIAKAVIASRSLA